MRQEECGMRQEESGMRQEESGVRQEESGMHQEESGVRQEESGVRQEESGVRQEESGVRQEESGVRQEESGMRQAEDGTRQEESGMRQEEEMIQVGLDRRARRDDPEDGEMRKNAPVHELFTPGATSRRAEAVTPYRVLFLGQINLRKGVGRLLDAMRLLKDERVELVMAGPSEIEPAAWADLPKVKWIGPVPRSEVGAVYRAADVFILPTLSDGYALTQLEALSHGLPVIASKHCGEAVTHGRNGWILDDLEPETIATAIRVAATESLPDVRPPEFSLADLAQALIR
jgi:glycosyltransferase involved in cell wall biosynthesis